MRGFLTISIHFICIVFFSNSLRMDGVFSDHSDCFAEYLQQVNNINNNFRYSFEACDDEDNTNREPPDLFDPQIEKEKLKVASQELCYNLSACNSIEDARDFFQCHKKIASPNMFKSTEINLNASSVIIEISDQYSEKEKEILRCHLAAKRILITDSSTSYGELMKCLHGNRRRRPYKYQKFRN